MVSELDSGNNYTNEILCLNDNCGDIKIAKIITVYEIFFIKIINLCCWINHISKQLKTRV